MISSTMKYIIFTCKDVSKFQEDGLVMNLAKRT